MSKLSMTVIASTGTGGCSTKYAEPRRPSSSPEKFTRRIERLVGCFAKRRASSMTAAVPEALSSAPWRMTVPESGSIELKALRPRWSKCAPTTTYSFASAGSEPGITATTFCVGRELERPACAAATDFA